MTRRQYYGPFAAPHQRALSAATEDYLKAIYKMRGEERAP